MNMLKTTMFALSLVLSGTIQAGTKDEKVIVPAAQEAKVCSNKNVCGQMDSCEEAQHYLNVCGIKRLDRDRDGVPCETLCN